MDLEKMKDKSGSQGSVPAGFTQSIIPQSTCRDWMLISRSPFMIFQNGNLACYLCVSLGYLSTYQHPKSIVGISNRFLSGSSQCIDPSSEPIPSLGKLDLDDRLRPSVIASAQFLSCLVCFEDILAIISIRILCPLECTC